MLHKYSILRQKSISGDTVQKRPRFQVPDIADNTISPWNAAARRFFSEFSPTVDPATISARHDLANDRWVMQSLFSQRGTSLTRVTSTKSSAKRTAQFWRWCRKSRGVVNWKSRSLRLREHLARYALHFTATSVTCPFVTRTIAIFKVTMAWAIFSNSRREICNFRVYPVKSSERCEFTFDNFKVDFLDSSQWSSLSL